MKTNTAKLTCWIRMGACLVFSFILICTAYSGRIFAAAGSTNHPVNVFAKVPSDITLEIKIFDMSNNTKKEVQSMDFGELLKTGEEYRSATFYLVEITAAANANPFEVRQSATPLVRNGGFEFMPGGAYIAKIPTLGEIITFDTAGNRITGAPAGAKVGETGSAVRDTMVYQSDDVQNKKVMIPINYTLSGDPALRATEVIPINQKSGNYSGTVIFTVTSK